MDTITKTLLVIGVIFLLSAALWHFSGGKIPLGRLPGDIRIESGNTKIFIPLTSSIVISVILTLVFQFFKK